MAAVVLLCGIVLVTAPAQRTVTVAGQVLGPGGNPVEGAEVLVQYQAQDDKVGDQRALSDAAGRFAIDCQVLNLELFRTPTCTTRQDETWPFGRKQPTTYSRESRTPVESPHRPRDLREQLRANWDMD